MWNVDKLAWGNQIAHINVTCQHYNNHHVKLSSSMTLVVMINTMSTLGPTVVHQQQDEVLLIGRIHLFMKSTATIDDFLSHSQ